MRGWRIATFLVIFTCFLVAASCNPSITILSYNTYNLFDDVDNGPEYDRYDLGRGGWTRQDFVGRLTAIGDVIRKSVAGGRDIVALQEVENRAVLDSLCDGPLRAMDYRYRYMAPAADQAVGCAIISRLPIRRTMTLNPGDWGGRQQRYILEAEIAYQDTTLIVFNGHWKSKTGGMQATESGRIASSRVLADRLKVLLADRPAADILVLGDFNENVEEYRDRRESYQTALLPADLLNELSGEARPGRRLAETRGGERPWQLENSLFVTGDPRETGMRHNGIIVLYDCWLGLLADHRGSYVFRGEWQTPDHILLSPGLFDGRGFEFGGEGFSVIRHSFLLDARSGFPGFTSGSRGREPAYSDHLPLLISLSVPGK